MLYNTQAPNAASQPSDDVCGAGILARVAGPPQAVGTYRLSSRYQKASASPPRTATKVFTHEKPIVTRAVKPSVDAKRSRHPALEAPAVGSRGRDGTHSRGAVQRTSHRSLDLADLFSRMYVGLQSFPGPGGANDLSPRSVPGRARPESHPTMLKMMWPPWGRQAWSKIPSTYLDSACGHSIINIQGGAAACTRDPHRGGTAPYGDGPPLTHPCGIHARRAPAGVSACSGAENPTRRHSCSRAGHARSGRRELWGASKAVLNHEDAPRTGASAS